ncbi:hypothetical protein BT96DRAFT_943824 [Gymnopus androsaceus JB14]|uniref:Uncharacterized protein n=1 Tax=Gymnopus androsaceus JB14 TaxID=1447944 RepID=A0A6A4H766_9AGAR|nr:hypothetical protein BT96DRAFT_943824 [Gymnopus androsaceus JB14]
MSHTAAESPLPLSQNAKPGNDLGNAKTLLQSYRWLPKSFNFTNCDTLLLKVIEKAGTNMKVITSVTTSQAKKKDWEMIHAAAIVTMNAFTAKGEHQAFESMAGRMEEQVEGFLQSRGEVGEIFTIDEEKLCLRVTGVLEEKFENKLAEMAGLATMIKLSDETAFMQIVADRVQANLQKPIEKLEREAEAAFKAAEEVMRQCNGLISEANETMLLLKEKVEKISEGLPAANGKGPKDWFDEMEEVELIVNAGSKSFAEAARSVMDKRVGTMANVLRALHAHVIRDARAAYQKVVIRERGQLAELHWMDMLSEKEIIERVNVALEKARDGDLFNLGPHLTGQFISARKIARGALVHWADEETARWMKKDDQMEKWVGHWEGEIDASFDTFDVIVEMVPVSEDIASEMTWWRWEEVNSLERNAIVKVHWIKAVERREEHQKVAHIICSFADGEQTKHAIRNGLIVQGEALEARKSLPEPRSCLKCHKFGHFAKGSFIRQREALWAQRTDLHYKYFVSEDPETWDSFGEIREEMFDKSWRE